MQINIELKTISNTIRLRIIFCIKSLSSCVASLLVFFVCFVCYFVTSLFCIIVYSSCL